MGHLHYTLSSQGQRRKEGWKECQRHRWGDYKETVFSGHSRAATHMNSQRFTAQMKLVRIRADTVPANRDDGHSYP